MRRWPSTNGTINIPMIVARFIHALGAFRAGLRLAGEICGLKVPMSPDVLVAAAVLAGTPRCLVRLEPHHLPAVVEFAALTPAPFGTAVGFAVVRHDYAPVWVVGIVAGGIASL